MAKLKGNAQAVYNSGGQTLADGAETGLFVDSTGALLTTASFTASDIEIGAVEIKDGTTDTRGTVKAASTTPLLTDTATVVTQRDPLPAGTNAIGSIVSITTSIVPGTAATNLGKAEDAVHTSGDTGIMALTVRSDTAAATAGATGDYQPQITDANGNTWVREYYAPAYEDNTNAVAKVEQRFSYINIPAGQATTVVKSGAGFLHTITLNSAATATNATTVYDNTAGSGTIIAKPAATTATVPTTLTYDVSFATGLTILTATANGSDMTISFR